MNMKEMKEKKPKKKPYTIPLPTIGPEEKFYGYIVGLGVGLTHPGDWEHDTRCYAMFQYNDVVTIWVVPDAELFNALAGYLCSMARFRCEFPDDFGYSKLWIKQTPTGAWSVQMP